MLSEAEAPKVDLSRLTEIAKDIFVIEDGRVPLVPNIGIILGTHAALVVDTGMGPENGRAVLHAAQRLAGDRKLLLTLTHFHPEHGYGAQAFKSEATIVYNGTQAEELTKKGLGYLQMFRGMNSAVAEALVGTELVQPDIAYDGSGCAVDLGGRMVDLQCFGPAHTRGDQTVFIPDAGVLFVGDLAEERIFPIFPWFPPDDADIDSAGWIATLERCEALRPAIVVPGHGSVGTVAIIEAVRTYMLDLRREVAARASRGLDADAIIAELKPATLARYPGWHFPEWIDFAIQTFVAQPAA